MMVGDVQLQIETAVQNNSEPYIVMSALDVTGVVLAQFRMNTQESRMVASWLFEASEAAESDSDIVTASRSEKIDEDIIKKIIYQLRCIRNDRRMP